MHKAQKFIKSVEGKPLSLQDRKEYAVSLAQILLKDSKKEQSREERTQGLKMSRMMDDESGKAMTLAMTDKVFRPVNGKRSAELFRQLVNEYGIPSYLPFYERFGMKVGAEVSRIMPQTLMSLITVKMRMESSKVILPAENNKLDPHLVKRESQETRMNLNLLGEAVLGEGEANNRFVQLQERLKEPLCKYVSVKVSAIFSQINLVAYDETLEIIKEKVRTLYRTAQSHPYIDENGEKRAKFVNLDMEEYRDLHLTCDAFKAVLVEEEFMPLRAGIVLQAYLPDSSEIQKELTEWARERVRRGGATIKVRIVKGANLAMESVEASSHHWELAPYYSKLEVDANYKRMVAFGCERENAKFVQIGIASHNLFDVSYALIIRSSCQTADLVEFEMLEGMANEQSRAVQSAAEGMLLYAPIVKQHDFHSAISYLVRRLDENTAEENFLHDIFAMEYDSPVWHKQLEMFRKACDLQDKVSTKPNRTQNRSKLPIAEFPPKFENVADTDWSLGHNVKWIREKLEQSEEPLKEEIPVQIAQRFRTTDKKGQGRNPSKNGEAFYTYSLAGEQDIDDALNCAVRAQSDWERQGLEFRKGLLIKAAQRIEECRGETIAMMTHDAGKAVQQSDVEVSEAIDFALYYAESLDLDALQDGVSFKARGVTVITPPWNFPYAISVGGILSALIAGNSVIFKPAPETVLTAWHIVNQLWDAGIPKDVLQFMACPDDEIGQSLITDRRVAIVVLTGAYETGRMFQGWKPNIRLYAETSGKNSLIITNAADSELAVKDLVYSAFGHSGQKCSAASLAIIEGDLYDDPSFRRQLKDAAQSLFVGDSENPQSFVTPLIRLASPELERALTTLDEGEEWLLEPKRMNGNDHLWSPGIKLGVTTSSWYFKTECFGPVLGLVRADNLKHAIQIQNNTEFGLTGGIHTLDGREIELWKHNVQVGNAYVNRPTTGAIVRRQPFGGWKKSCFGPGAKAGGPNYVSQFVTWTDQALPSQTLTDYSPKVSQLIKTLSQATKLPENQLIAIAGSYQKWMREEFAQEHDPSQIKGETNVFRYVPVKGVVVRLESHDELTIAKALLASSITGVKVAFSLAFGSPQWLVNLVETQTEEQTFFCSKIATYEETHNVLRIPQPTLDMYRAVNGRNMQLIDWEFSHNGRIELSHYFREQSISHTIHRYGNLIPTAEELSNKS